MTVNELLIPTLAGVFLCAGTAVGAAAGGPCTENAAASSCVPGGGTARTDCNVEWSVTLLPSPTTKGLPQKTLACFEGDTRCDFDPDWANASCTFHVGLCINNADPRLPTCAPSQLALIAVQSPKLTSLGADLANRQALDATRVIGTMSSSGPAARFRTATKTIPKIASS